MCRARSAERTCSAARSASEYTATVSMPRSRQVRITRTAISPRLATRTRRIRAAAFMRAIYRPALARARYDEPLRAEAYTASLDDPRVVYSLIRLIAEADDGGAGPYRQAGSTLDALRRPVNLALVID